MVALPFLLLALLVALVARTLAGSGPPATVTAPASHPLVLVHGIFGFDELGLGRARVSYFRGVVERLRELGAEVHCARVPPLAPIHVRAQRLAEMVRALDAPRVHLVAHSMGGLDARYALSRLGLASRVASLTTIGTPHRGTPIADLGAELLRRLRLDIALGPLVNLQALHDLTPSRMLAFNRQVRDLPSVRYLSVVARAPDSGVHPLLRPAHQWLQRSVGANDGLVPSRSQRWGTVLCEVEADHWSQIGWSTGGSSEPAVITLYDKILQHLRSLDEAGA